MLGMLLTVTRTVAQFDADDVDVALTHNEGLMVGLCDDSRERDDTPDAVKLTLGDAVEESESDAVVVRVCVWVTDSVAVEHKL